MKFDMIDKILTDVKDYHMPFAGGVFVIGTCLQWFHHLDATYLTFTTSILTFIATHKWLNKDDPNSQS